MHPMTIHFYAIFREQAGRSSESYEGTAVTMDELYRELANRHGFTLPPEQVRAAVGTDYVSMDTPLVMSSPASRGVSTDYVSMDTPLEAGLDITFIPPVAGG